MQPDFLMKFFAVDSNNNRVKDTAVSNFDVEMRFGLFAWDKKLVSNILAICRHRLPRIRFAVKAKTTNIGIAGHGGNKIVSKIAMRLNSGRFSSSFAKYHMLPKSN